MSCCTRSSFTAAYLEMVVPGFVVLCAHLKPPTSVLKLSMGNSAHGCSHVASQVMIHLCKKNCLWGIAHCVCAKMRCRNPEYIATYLAKRLDTTCHARPHNQCDALVALDDPERGGVLLRTPLRLGLPLCLLLSLFQTTASRVLADYMEMRFCRVYDIRSMALW